MFVIGGLASVPLGFVFTIVVLKSQPIIIWAKIFTLL